MGKPRGNSCADWNSVEGLDGKSMVDMIEVKVFT